MVTQTGFQPGVPPFNFEGCLTRVGWSAQASRATVAEPGVQGAFWYDEGNGHNDENGDRDHVRGNIFGTLGTLKT